MSHSLHRIHFQRACGGNIAEDSRPVSASRRPPPARLAVILVALLLAGAGCATQTSQSGPGANPPEGPVVLAAQALQGYWHKACGAALPSNGPATLFDQVELTVDGAELRTRIRTFTDAACSLPYRYAADVVVHARLQPGAVIAGTNLAQVRAVDLATQPYAGAAFEPREFLVFAMIGDHLYWSSEEPERDGLSPERRARRLDFERPFKRIQHPGAGTP